MHAAPPCLGAILAGGRATRMGGTGKAFTPLHGRAMIERVIARLLPQVRSLLLCVDAPDAAFAALGLPLVTDVVRSHRGPLTGLCSALQHLRDRGAAQWLLLCPCDAPFLPRDLAPRLLVAAVEAGQPVASARYAGHAQPTFSAWHVDTCARVEAAALQRGQGGLMHMLDHLPHVMVDWPEREPPPFFNVNTPQDVALAAGWLDRGGDED